MNLVFDIGMNNGADTRRYLLQGHRVVAVEADPRLCAAACEKFADSIESGQLRVLNVGLGGHVGSGTFYVNTRFDEWSSFNKTLASRVPGQPGVHDESIAEPMKIPVVTFAHLVENYGMPWYAKIDVEGHDHYCLRDVVKMEGRPTFMSVEFSGAALGLLPRTGYTRFKLVNQKHHNDRASGHAGDDAVDVLFGRAWTTLERLENTYADVAKWPTWWDIHMTN